MQKKLQQLPYYKWLIFGVISIGVFMATMASSIVNVALPPITLALHTDIPTAQWVVTAYLLTITSLLPLMGRLGDVLGRRFIYGYGFVGFAASSLLCGMTDSIGMLIGSRIIQAVSASTLMANGMAIVTAYFPPGERGKVLGMVGTIVALGSLSGPGIGGLLVDNFSWHAIFYVNIPIGLLGYAGVCLVLPADQDLQQEKIDYLGALLFTISMVSFLLALSYGTLWGWLSVRTITCLGLAGVMFILFIWQEIKIDYPMLELSIFKNWEFSTGNLAGMLSFMAMFSNTLLLPYFLHDILAFTPAKTGMIMSAFPLVMAIVAPLSGSLSDRVGTGMLATTGLGILAFGLVLTARLQVGTALWLIMASQAIMGLGNAMFQSPNNNSIMSAVPPRQLGVASGVNALARNFGMVCGTVVSVSIFEYRRAASLSVFGQPTQAQQVAAFMDGYQTALLVGAALAVTGALVSCRRSGKKTAGK